MARKSAKHQFNLDLGKSDNTVAPPQNGPKEKPDPYSSEIDRAQKLLEELKLKKDQQEREEARQREINLRKDTFLDLREDLTDRLTDAIPKIERELSGAKQEILDLEQAKKHFSLNLNSIEAINPNRWDDEEVIEQTDKYNKLLEKMSDEFDQFMLILSEGRNESSPQFSVNPDYDFKKFGFDALRGLAFSLPLIIVLIIVSTIL